MILADTSGLLALLDRGEAEHRRVSRAVEKEPGPLVVIDVVLAETDYLIRRRLGRQAGRAFLDQVLEGVFLREEVTDGDLRRASEIDDRYHESDLGLTDSALMAIAERLAPSKVLTLDRKHFAPFRTLKGEPLDLLPR